MNDINRLLLIDDDEITNYLHQDLINRMAIANELIAFNGADDALAYIEQQGWRCQHKITNSNIILLDINMPGKDGFDFLEAYQNLYSPEHYKVFIVSSSQNARDISKAKDYRISGYVTKPLTNQKVRAIVETVQQENKAACEACGF